MGGEVMDHGNARMDGFFNVQVINSHRPRNVTASNGVAIS